MFQQLLFLLQNRNKNKELIKSQTGVRIHQQYIIIMFGAFYVLSRCSNNFIARPTRFGLWPSSGSSAETLQEMSPRPVAGFKLETLQFMILTSRPQEVEVVVVEVTFSSKDNIKDLF